ncbi:hypothetical protein Bpfe_023619 [Biomphalaria pfeifferi]|uniref:Uncharacterized protein n=1 Tax=Biomphalaria pfeifferi TaxID=112525 RepID=A0AAD8F1G1_BIOPF|nr:hypothetical protein Bpfe_023619 [Biomphalaria pfeifferi]
MKFGTRPRSKRSNKNRQLDLGRYPGIFKDNLKCKPMITRSTEKRKIQDMKKISQDSELMDSAYDTDKSMKQSVSPACDPYNLVLTDDDENDNNTKKKKNKQVQKRNKTQTRSRSTRSKTTKTDSARHKQTLSSSTSTPVLHPCAHEAKGHKVNSTSTPVLEHCLNETSTLTPEVTPILVSKPFDCASPTSNFVTPQLPRSVRKRDGDKSDLDNISKQLNYSSLTDSGIELSLPPSKKKLPEKFSFKNEKSNKENSFTAIHIKKQRNAGVPILGEKNQNTQNKPHSKETCEHLQDMGVKDSCFGFDSLNSPQISPPKRTKVAKCTTEESHANACSQSSPDSLLKDLSSSNRLVDTNSPPTTPLFEEGIAKDSECLEVNKSSSKTYKPSNRKFKKRISVSKIDEWATHFNMEIEEAEKFDLNIE